MTSRDLLLHPVRLRIVQALVGRPLTPLALKEQLGDVAQATLYRHIKELHDSGFIDVIDERQVRGGSERTYAVVESAVHLGPDELADSTRDDHVRYFLTFLGTLIADFCTYLESNDPDLAVDGVGYQQTPLWLSDEEFADFAEEVSRVIRARLGNSPEPGRRRRLFTTVVMPDRRHD